MARKRPGGEREIHCHHVTTASRRGTIRSRRRPGRCAAVPRLHRQSADIARLGGLPGRAGPDGQPPAAARARHHLAGPRPDRWRRLVRRGGCRVRHAGEPVRGLVLVNPSLAPDTKLFLLAPVLKYVLRSLPGITSDISKPGGHEVGYDRVPVRAAATLPRLWNETVKHLGEVTQPVLVYRSPTDHVVGPASMRALLAGVPAGQVTVRECADSYHVATLDNDAETIFEGSLKFIQDYAG